MSWLRCHLLVLTTGLLGCSFHRSATDPVAEGRRYVEDAAFRRHKLEASLVNESNPYSKLRLAKYREDAWGALPEWNPPFEVVSPTGARSATRTIDVEAVPWTHDALIALGRDAFFHYPVQIQDAVKVGLAHPEPYGLWRSADSLGGIVRATLPVGGPRLSLTCATCHASAGADGQIIAGRANARLALGAMLHDNFGSAVPDTWGRGRVDLTNDSVDNPIAISDLRAIRSERYLHHDGTIRNGLIELAIRIETLIITSNDSVIRPPRKLVFAMALYLWELPITPAAIPSEASHRGEALFTERCARCHVPSDYSGERIPLAEIGTDPTVGEIAERTTGGYRTPSLRGVGDRTPLFASGQVASLDELLDPSRKARGHRYGMDLSLQSRTDLIAFLSTIQ